jgi:hypothetical protein
MTTCQKLVVVIIHFNVTVHVELEQVSSVFIRSISPMFDQVKENVMIAFFQTWKHVYLTMRMLSPNTNACKIFFAG